MNVEELARLIKSRRSIRVWQDRPVSEKMLLEAVELATWAPNGGNAQAWYFYIVVKRATVKAIADAIEASAANVASWPEIAQSELAAPGSLPRGTAAAPGQQRTPLSQAPALILVGVRKGEHPLDRILAARAGFDQRAGEMLHWSRFLNPRLQSGAAAVAYLLLTLHQMGLGAVWMVGPLAMAKGDIEKILGAPADLDIIAMIPVGYPAESPTKDRRPVAEVCQVIK
jgi:nitroreductase